MTSTTHNVTPAVSSAPFANKLPPASLMRSLSPASRSQDIFNAPASAFDRQDDFYEGLPHSYPLLYVEEAAQQLSCSEHHVRDLIDEGALLAFPINEAEESKRKRNIYRVVRQTCVRDDRLTASGAHDLVRSVNSWLLPSSLGSRSVLTVFETATALRCTGQHVRKLYDNRLLRAVDIASPSSQIATLRIARESLVAFVTIRLARQNNIKI